VAPPLPADVWQVSVSWLGPYTMFLTPTNFIAPSYAGPAPYEVAGASQMNFVVPDSYTNGSYQALYLNTVS